jgi:hypothetical protein
MQSTVRHYVLRTLKHYAVFSVRSLRNCGHYAVLCLRNIMEFQKEWTMKECSRSGSLIVEIISLCFSKELNYLIRNLIIDFPTDIPGDIPIGIQGPPAVAPVPPVAVENIGAPAMNPLNPSRKRPARVPGLVGTSAAYLVPDNIRKKFVDGWNVHVPLTFLTDKGCLLKDKSAVDASLELLSINSSTGIIQTSSTSLIDDGELDLTFDEWHQAWRRLLDLIRSWVAHEFALWETHYLFILNKENRAELWPLYLTYDVEIRKRSVQTGIDPSQFSIAIWNDLEARYTAKKVLSIVRSDLKHQTNRTSSDKHKPRNPGNKSSFRDHRQSSSESQKTGRCLFCGDRTKDHLSRNCTATCFSNGVPCHLHRIEPSGTHQSKSGKRYCYAWNGISGCDDGSACTRGEHLCTLCGTSAHTAQQCSVVP